MGSVSQIGWHWYSRLARRLPVTLVTLGLFLFVINALMFWAASGVLSGFHVNGFWAALIGSLIMSSLTTGLQMLNVAPSWQYLVKGLVLVIAVYADVSFKKNR